MKLEIKYNNTLRIINNEDKIKVIYKNICKTRIVCECFMSGIPVISNGLTFELKE